jgi:hypothetical protein
MHHLCREFLALFDPNGPEGARLLQVLLSQHAALLVSGLLSAFNSTQDLGVSLVGSHSDSCLAAGKAASARAAGHLPAYHSSSSSSSSSSSKCCLLYTSRAVLSRSIA